MLLKETLRSIVKSQHSDLSLYELGVKREKLAEIGLDSPLAIVVSGIRRCGKSTLLRQLMAKSGGFYYFHF